MIKLDFKKELKQLYSAKQEPVIVQVPKFKYLTVLGKGDPNISQEYKDALESLYPTIYTLKFMVKKGETNIDPVDFVVMPLEGQWWADNMEDFITRDKNNWKWKMMIMLPDFITQDVINLAIEKARQKKELKSISLLKFEELEDGRSGQILHIGAYSYEGPTIQKLHDFIKSKGYSLNGLHREIYLGDPRKTAPDKLKTIIRQPCN